MIPIKFHVPFAAILAVLTIAPVALSIVESGSKQKAIADRLNQQVAATDLDIKIGKQRARTCQVLSAKTPITSDSAPVVYEGTQRQIPVGTALCDLNGFTAIQGDTGVADIRPIPVDELQKALNRPIPVDESKKVRS